MAGDNPVGLGFVPGNYGVEEVDIPTNWTLTNIVCESIDGNSTSTFGTFEPGENALDVELGAGDRVVCTFTNCFMPTFGGVSVDNTCTGKRATVTLTGLIPNTEFEVTYTLGDDDPETVIVTSNANGEATFETRVVSFADDNGATLTITSIDYDDEEDANNTCPNEDLSNNTATLNVLNVDCGEFPWRGNE